ncbi:MAG TPA: oligosaccharide flippase family protein [Polyangiaceae bacterium]|nr:oligosaccharide flippase family protein [Polyangiaceae bacterium]
MPRQTSLRWNVAANYAGQIYAAVVNVVFLPVQVHLLGAEAYGLVGFFAVLSGWLMLLDVGLTPTVSRETAKFSAGALERPAYQELLRSLEILFFALGLMVALGVFGLSGPIARHWLHPEKLATSSVSNAVALMGLSFAFRWQATLSRSVLSGLERQVWINLVTAVFATLRSIGVLAVLKWVDSSPGAFFVYQSLVAALELVALRLSVRKFLGVKRGERSRFSFAAIRRVASFSLTIALTSTAWLFATQMDKLLLSKLLPLSEYAFFSLAVTAATGVNMLAGPIGQAVQPRLTYLFAERNDSAFALTYSNATQMLSATALTASFLLAIAARPVLWAWTGNAELARQAAPVLALYALGNGLLAVGAVTYYLQIAGGDLRLHLRGTLIFSAMLLPAVVLATLRAGMLGASVAWFVGNLIFFLGWIPLIHRRFLPGSHLRWLARDVMLPAAVGSIPILLFRQAPVLSLPRLQLALGLMLAAAISVCGAALMTRPARGFLVRLRRRPMPANSPR